MENEIYKSIEVFAEKIWVINVEGLILKTSKYSRRDGFIDRINEISNKNFSNQFRVMTQQECFEHGKQIGKLLYGKYKERVSVRTKQSSKNISRR